MAARLEMVRIRYESQRMALNRRSGMKRTGVAFLTAAIAGWASLLAAHAAPPTVTPSPGYDARLREQRSAPPTVQQQVLPVVKPVPPRRAKKPPMN